MTLRCLRRQQNRAAGPPPIAARKRDGGRSAAATLLPEGAGGADGVSSAPAIELHQHAVAQAPRSAARARKVSS